MSELTLPAAPAERLIRYLRVAAQLRQEILDGSLRPDTRLPMQALAERCGVSVQPVREALQQLQGEGLVEIIPNCGARVRGLDRTRVLHIFEMREALETFMTRRFAEEAGASDIAVLAAVQQRHDAAAEAGDITEVLAANRIFHSLITGHGGNIDVTDLAARYADLTGTLGRRLGRGAAYLARVRREHHAMLAAFRKRDASRAGDVAAAHVRAARIEILAFVDRTTRQD